MSVSEGAPGFRAWHEDLTGWGNLKIIALSQNNCSYSNQSLWLYSVNFMGKGTRVLLDITVTNAEPSLQIWHAQCFSIPKRLQNNNNKKMLTLNITCCPGIVFTKQYANYDVKKDRPIKNDNRTAAWIKAWEAVKE